MDMGTEHFAQSGLKQVCACMIAGGCHAQPGIDGKADFLVCENFAFRYLNLVHSERRHGLNGIGNHGLSSRSLHGARISALSS